MPSAHPVSSFPYFLLLSSGHLATSPSKRVSPHWPAEAANWVSCIGNSKAKPRGGCAKAVDDHDTVGLQISNSSYHFMKPSKDLPGLLQHPSPIKQVTNFYTDPHWERLRICRREHLGTKPCSFMPFIPKRASHSYNLFLKCAQECLIQKSLHLLPACQVMSFLTSLLLLPHPALRSDVI